LEECHFQFQTECGFNLKIQINCWLEETDGEIQE
jgi:hypothetical protein